MNNSLKSLILASSIGVGSLVLSGCVTYTETYSSPVPVYSEPNYFFVPQHNFYYNHSPVHSRPPMIHHPPVARPHSGPNIRHR